MKCAICGKPVEQVKPCIYYRRRGEVTCDECCEECYRTEPFPCRDHDARVQEAEPITFYWPDGTIGTRGGYGEAVEKLCILEDQHHPSERYTFHMTGSGKPCARRGHELVLGRLYEYERGRF